MGPGRVDKELDRVQSFATLSRTRRGAAAKQAAASLFLFLVRFISWRPARSLPAIDRRSIRGGGKCLGGYGAGHPIWGCAVAEDREVPCRQRWRTQRLAHRTGRRDARPTTAAAGFRCHVAGPAKLSCAA